MHVDTQTNYIKDIKAHKEERSNIIFKRSVCSMENSLLCINSARRKILTLKCQGKNRIIRYAKNSDFTFTQRTFFSKERENGNLKEGEWPSVVKEP